MQHIPARAPPPRFPAPEWGPQPVVGAGCQVLAPVGLKFGVSRIAVVSPTCCRCWGMHQGLAEMGAPGHPAEGPYPGGRWHGCRLTPPPPLLYPQGVPLDTSKLPADQRLPPYSYSQSGLLLQSQPSQKALHQPMQSPPQPALPPALPARPAVPPVPPSGATQRPYAPQYQPNASLQQQQQQLGQPLSDFGLGSVSAPGTGDGGGTVGWGGTDMAQQGYSSL